MAQNLYDTKKQNEPVTIIGKNGFSDVRASFLSDFHNFGLRRYRKRITAFRGAF
jgi:hypothetical protein